MNGTSAPDGPATFIAVGVVRDSGAMVNYASKATPLLEAAGGSAVKRYRVKDRIEGAEVPAILFVMQFESETALRASLASDAYRALVPERNLAFSRLDLWIGEAD